jgi:hypothetical protein
MELVRRIFTSPEVWDGSTDDFSPARETFQPVDSEAIWYVTIQDGDELIGMWVLTPEGSPVCLQIHTCFLRECGFHRGRTAAREFPTWVWANTPCRRLVTNCPDFNRAARMVARVAGFTEYGYNPSSFLKGGALYGQTLLGISRPE